VQVGGGVRSIDTARTLLDEGAERVIVGTAAAEQPDALRHWLEELGSQHLVVGVDAREGRVATRGWLTMTDVDLVAFVQQLGRSGVERIVYTDVARDGLQGGPDVETTRELAKTVKVIGSGGVSSVEHLRALADAGAEGAIIGTALYEGRLGLREALAVAC
jgi:phosphoribosylformimino-5-aminoimidazole carboxamide ribotide isomerase